MTISFHNRIALVTGAGRGLGREYALLLARYGARVVVSDVDPAAQQVVDEIASFGGTARLLLADVSDEGEVGKLVEWVEENWGPVDTLICNAGILRDRSFTKMSISDFRKVVDVHLIGSAICIKAVWEGMRENNFGRIVLTSSASGIYGNFGQANYGAAKAGMIGLMNVLNKEGAARNIKVNIISPAAATEMTDDIFPEEIKAALNPANVAPATVFLASEEAPAGVILSAGAGSYSATEIRETEGIYLRSADRNVEGIRKHIRQICDPAGGRISWAGPKELTDHFLELRNKGESKQKQAGS